MLATSLALRLVNVLWVVRKKFQNGLKMTKIKWYVEIMSDQEHVYHNLSPQNAR